MSRRNRLMVVGLSILVSLSLATPAAALPFDTLIDIGPPLGQLEAGAIASGGSPHNTGNTDLPTTALVTLGGDPFTLAIDDTDALGNDDGGIDWRDRGNAAAIPLARLAEEFVKNNSGTIRVTLGTLPAGIYRATSYHIDSSFSQSEAIKVLVDDARVGGYIDTGAVGDASFTSPPGIGGLTTAIVQGTSATFEFYSNGTDPVRILFDGNAASDTEVPLNGLRVRQRDIDNQHRDFAFIDFGLSGQRVEPGFTGVTTTAATTVNDLYGGSFTVALSSVGWRDRGNSTSAEDLVWLAEDFVKNDAGDITVTLSGLRAGAFLVASYHMDPGLDQSADIEVYVTDAVGTDVLQPAAGDASNNVALNSLTTDNINYSGAVFQIMSNGADDVLIRFNGTGDDLETPLNGLALQLITPEPGTMSLLALGGLGALIRRRRRRRQR